MIVKIPTLTAKLFILKTYLDVIMTANFLTEAIYSRGYLL